MIARLPFSTSATVPCRQARALGVIRLALALAAVLLGLTGCTTYRTEPPQRASQVFLLSWLQVGKTTREELQQEWGSPSASLQEGRIVFYRLEGTGKGLRFSTKVGSWERCRHSLVLIFNSTGVLEKSSLVRVR